VVGTSILSRFDLLHTHGRTSELHEVTAVRTDEGAGVPVQFEPGEVTSAEEWPPHLSVGDHGELGTPTHRTLDLFPPNLITRSARVVQGSLRRPIEPREE